MRHLRASSRLGRLSRRRRSPGRPAVVAAVLAGVACLAMPTAAHADVEDFTFSSWDARYEISLDDEGRAVASVVETITARFPDFDQNRGIVRGLPLRHAGAPAAPEDIAVVDEDGEEVPFDVEEDDGFRAVLTGDAAYVRGEQTYVISYTLHDVVAPVDDADLIEFSWDVLPIERAQDVEAFSAEIVFEDGLADALTGDAACYLGEAGSTERCELAATDGGVTLPPRAMPGGEGVTIAVGLEPGSVVQPPEREPSFALDGLPILLGAGATALGAGATTSVIRMRRKRRTATGIVVAQYEVPAELPPLLAAHIGGATGEAVTAEILHLAVNGVVRLEDHADDDASEPAPAVRLLDPSRTGDPLDDETVEALFSDAVDGVVEPPEEDTEFSARMTTLVGSGLKAATARGMMRRERSRAGVVLGVVSLCALPFVAALLIAGAGREAGPAQFVGIVGGLLAVVLALVGLSKHRVLTHEGALAHEHLEGVKEFIRVAEADRLRVLQSYEGAERTPDGEVDVIRVYEKLLPYAVLFGQERSWSTVLRRRYSDAGIGAPAWYPAMYAHVSSSTSPGGALSAWTSSFSSSASYTASSSSSSTGGGFSGGGGGGGFAGGR